MRFVWLAIIAVSGIPVVVLAAYFSPFLILLVGIEGWRERLTRLRPYRLWLLFALAICAFSTAVYTARYG